MGGGGFAESTSRGSRRAAVGGARDACGAGAVHGGTTGFPLRYTRSAARTGPRRRVRSRADSGAQSTQSTSSHHDAVTIARVVDLIELGTAIDARDASRHGQRAVVRACRSPASSGRLQAVRRRVGSRMIEN